MSTDHASQIGSRRPHRKSRNGCMTCKRRRVKCDEEKPACTNCIQFGVPCDFSLPRRSAEPDSRSPTPTADHSADDGASKPLTFLRRRGRGRPRRDWSTPQIPATSSKCPENDQSPATTEHTATTSDLCPTPAGSCSLNVTDIELLLHFSSSTALTLAGSDESTDPIAKFWVHNVPRIGLSHHFVIHLALAVAGYHLSYLQGKDGKDAQRQHYRSLAEGHVAAGLAEFNSTLSNLNDSNAGALYVAATLVCYYTFAAGPTGPSDLLVCHDNEDTENREDNEKDTHWVRLVHGVRLIRSTIDPAILFSGLMAPLGPTDESPTPKQEPACARQNIARIDWEKPLHDLRGFITICDDDPHVDVVLRSFGELSDIYEAVYGRNDGSFNGSPQDHMVFAWLYRLEDDFVSCLRRREPLALIVFAYYAVLFQTMDNVWYMDGWREHILVTTKNALNAVGNSFTNWLRWPIEQAGLDWT